MRTGKVEKRTIRRTNGRLADDKRRSSGALVKTGSE